MDSSPITTWSHVSAYYTFFNHEAVILAILIASIAVTVGVIVGVMRHEKLAEAALEDDEVMTSDIRISGLAVDSES